jgi:Lrp/AsnC family transcriptional regulator for asnA, asnC and gidA
MTMRSNLDAIDKQILRELQIDGRASYAEIAEIVKLTPPAVRARIQKLRDTGVLQIVAVTDPIALGYTESAIIGIRVDGLAKDVADRLGEIKNVIYMVMSVGGYDIMCEIVCQSREEFADVLHNKIRSIEGVRSADAFPYTSIHTQRFSWDVPN